MTISTIGFIGLGVMGEAMCRNLARKGSWKVVAFDQRQEPLERLKGDNVGIATSLRGLAQAADLILMCLPGGREVEIVTQGASGLIALMRAGQTLVDMSTAPPALMRKLADDLAAKGADFADAPIARTRRAGNSRFEDMPAHRAAASMKAASMKAARATSFSLSPPQSCVERVISTVE